MKAADPRSAFGLMELIVVVAVIALLSGIFLSRRNHGPGIALSIKCIHNLKNIGLAFRIFSTDNSNRFPPEALLSNGVNFASIDALRVYLTLSNELSTPKILYCPKDKGRNFAESFTNLHSKNISYFASLSATELMTNDFLAGDRNLQTNGVSVSTGLIALSTNSAVSWSEDIHVGQGDVAMADGSVQQLSSNRLKEAVRVQRLKTNYLAMP